MLLTGIDFMVVCLHSDYSAASNFGAIGGNRKW